MANLTSYEGQKVQRQRKKGQGPAVHKAVRGPLRGGCSGGGSKDKEHQGLRRVGMGVEGRKVTSRRRNRLCRALEVGKNAAGWRD